MAGNLLPIVLVGGGILLFAGGKKKRRRKETTADVWQQQSVQPTKAPAAAAKTSGPSGKAASSEVWKARQTALAFVAGMKVCNCHPGKVDGIFGPATIAAIIAFQICAGITPDGKWGPKTDAAMKKMLADIARGQVKVAKPTSPKSVPKIGPREVGISPDYTQLKIGSSWRIAVLDAFLEERRKSGELITDPKGVKFWDVVLHDPSQFLGELTGLEGETAQNVGYAIYGALWVMATAGMAIEASFMYGTGILWIYLPMEELMAVGAAAVLEGIIIADYQLWRDNRMAATAFQSISAFMKSHYAIVGDKKVRLDKIPLDKPAGQKLNKLIVDYVYNFQMRTYEG